MECFPLLTRAQADDSSKLPKLSEYIEAIEHNLRTAETACVGTQWPAATAAYHQQDGKILLFAHDAQAIARAGDMAVRSAISALELALQLTNYCLGLNFRKNRVAWSVTDNGPNSFRIRVSNHLGASAALLQLLDRVFASHQFALFKDYRNWTTHRGAPKVISPLSTGRVVALEPLQYAAVQHEATAATAVNDYLMRECSVQSVPFVPTIRALLDDEKGQRPEQVGLGIVAPPGSELQLRDNYVVVGDPLMSEADYRAANPVELGEDWVEVAGEQLRVYRAPVYSFAVHQAVMFVRMVLDGDWDGALATLY